MDHVGALAHEGALLVAAVRRADPGAPVAGCTGWEVRDLAGHVGRVHRWAAGIARIGRPVRADATVPGDDDLAGWLEAGLHDLGAALSEDPDRSCWTFAGPATVRWWQRRQALETLIHRIDAERAAGAGTAVDALLAADGIAEVVDIIQPHQVRRGSCAPATARVLLTASDTATSAVLEGPAPEVAVDGPAEALLLLLWRRTTADDPRLSVRGGRRRLCAVLDDALTP